MALPAAGIYSRKHRRESFYYLDRDGYSIAVWQHSPGADSARDRAVLICPPIGYEYTHTHRTLRRVAEYFSDHGFYVFRLDYCGAGDSSGPEYCDHSLDRWTGDIKALSHAVQQSFPELKQTWVGLRLGATLAYLAAESGLVDSLVMWTPIIKGRPYIRELEAISKLAAVPQECSDDYFECAGFILSRAVAGDVKNINLLKQAIPENLNRLLVVSASADDYGGKLVDLVQPHQVEISSTVMNGFEDMMAVPHKAKVPWPTIKEIGDYLLKISKSKDSANAVVLMPPAARQYLKITGESEPVKEEGVFIGEGNELFAVKSTPAEKSVQALKGCILLLNSGSVHHVGPNAIYAQMARKLAQEGFAVLRLDLQNIGDSLVRDPVMENHPYQANAQKDIGLAINYLNRQFPDIPVTISGVCSGAYHAFQAGTSASPDLISQILIINPLTFYWRSDMSLDLPNDLMLLRKQSGYKKSMKNMDKWKGLLANPEKLTYAVLFVFRRAFKLASDVSKDLWSMAGGSKKPLAQDLEAIWSRGIRVAFIFSSRDPGLNIVNSEAGRVLRKGVKKGTSAVYCVEDADHTFSTKASRERLLSLIGTAYSHEKSSQDN